MRLSRKSEYACLALIDLASRHTEGGHSKVREVAERQGIPRGFLVQILLRLKNAGYVRSARGAAGGYQLAKPPEEITVAEVVRLMDGALAPVGSVSRFFYDHTPIEKSPKLVALFTEIRNHVARKLETTTLRDLI
jgi:Rrf2 family cysteine metabolism transcriptional repressor